MKTKLFLLMALFAISNVNAQFHTLMPRPKHYKVERVYDQPLMPIPVLPSDTASVENVTPVTIDTVASLPKSQSLLEQYLSVSLPLNKLYVTSRFGMRMDPFKHKPKMHSGLDLKANNEECYAMLAGKITKVGHDKKSGVYVKMKSGDYEISYCHLSATLVVKGQEIFAGQAVGITGSTGRSTGPHLHVTVKRKGKICDPTMFIDGIRSFRKRIIHEIAEERLAMGG